jgi:dextranase
MKFRFLCVCLFVGSVGFGCKESNETSDPTPTEVPVNTITPAYGNVYISTDKAAYNPGSEVAFTIDIAKLPATAKVRYKYLNQVVAEAAVTTANWTWKTPATDFRGYIAEVFSTANNIETIHAAIGVDVSSDWKKFPRYGFLSKFPQMSDADVNAVTSNLNRHHINGLQFYDWHNKHHQPLPVTGSTPANVWKDIINRDIYFNTIQKYISSAHGFNMKAMQYNLISGPGITQRQMG